MRTLLVGTNAVVNRSLTRTLADDGLTLDLLNDLKSAASFEQLPTYDLLIVSDDPPRVDARIVCRAVRAADLHVPILVTSGRRRVTDRVRGLDAGADDYIVRPFARAELRARVRALLRRRNGNAVRSLEVDNLSLDPITHKVRRGARRIQLTAKEFAVLECLMRRSGQAVSRETIAEYAWNKRWDALTNAIDVFVSRLRKKIEHPGERRLLGTVRGLGYFLRSSAR